jgi:hypothetical protein
MHLLLPSHLAQLGLLPAAPPGRQPPPAPRRPAPPAAIRQPGVPANAAPNLLPRALRLVPGDALDCVSIARGPFRLTVMRPPFDGSSVAWCRALGVIASRPQALLIAAWSLALCLPIRGPQHTTYHLV